MFRRFTLLLMIGLALIPRVVLAHNGYAVPDDVWSHWSWNLAPVLLIVCAIYGTGVWTLWRRAGRGHGVGVGQVAAFGGGMLALALALVSPLDAMSGALLSAHMIQHLLLLVVAPPLLVLGAPFVPLLWGLPPTWRRPATQWTRFGWVRALWRIIRHPAAAWLLHAVTLWLWHVPALYEAAVAHEPVHVLEHVCFFGTGLLYWWTLLRTHDYGLGVLSVFGMAVQSGLLGALMIFSVSAWYRVYMTTAPLWGLTALEDQQLAGGIMWVPAGMVYILASVLLLVAWLRTIEMRVSTREGRLALQKGESVS